ncbi:hypothetical protein J2X63_001762 [Agromyces sp. 3263]|uniref:hypothetical protein n=1 Tax=Agromyces sp. 3263 TaxID=2817750 RepID=UPI0028564B9E|nr:hypothetical protein [Agromyces sp. 3263]MDR6906076.1 hypothetical protein [Agromyces sp. 3263]
MSEHRATLRSFRHRRIVMSSLAVLLLAPAMLAVPLSATADEGEDPPTAEVAVPEDNGGTSTPEATEISAISDPGKASGAAPLISEVEPLALEDHPAVSNVEPAVLEAAAGDPAPVTPTILTLEVDVANGESTPAQWSVNAYTPFDSGATPGPAGPSGATGEVTPGAPYSLIADGDIRYAVGTWRCLQVDANGAVIPGYADGLNSVVTVPLGFSVVCTVTVEAAELTLANKVIDTGEGVTESDFVLTATPFFLSTLPPETVTGSTGGSTITVSVFENHDLSISGPPGYATKSIECNTGPAGAWVAVTSLRLAPLADVTCLFVSRSTTPLSATITGDLNVGGAVTVIGHSFEVGESVTGVLQSTPVALGSRIVGPEGTAVFAFVLPSGIEPGPHTVTLTGATSGEVAVAFTVGAALVVAPAPTAAAVVAPAPTATAVAATPALAATNVGGMWLAPFAIALLLAGAVMSRMRNRRRMG